MTEEKKDLPNQPEGYKVPKIWQWNSESGGKFANINRPISGATHEQELPIGQTPSSIIFIGYTQWRQSDYYA